MPGTAAAAAAAAAIAYCTKGAQGDLTVATVLARDEETAKTGLFRACTAGDAKAVESISDLLDRAGIPHAEQQVPDAWGSTPFFAACERGHLAVVSHLASKIGEAQYPESGPSWNKQPGGYVLSRPNVAGECTAFFEKNPVPH